MDWRHVEELVVAGRSIYGAMLNLIAWVKTNAGQGSFYRSQHELIGVFRVGTLPHLNTVELGRHGRNRSNVWHYAGANTFRAGRMDDLQAHPTVKPIALIADAIKDCTLRNQIVLDTFCGSGSTLLAAERTGRRGYGLEIDPGYVDVAVRRWQTLTGTGRCSWGLRAYLRRGRRPACRPTARPAQDGAVIMGRKPITPNTGGQKAGPAEPGGPGPAGDDCRTIPASSADPHSPGDPGSLRLAMAVRPCTAGSSLGNPATPKAARSNRAICARLCSRFSTRKCRSVRAVACGACRRLRLSSAPPWHAPSRAIPRHWLR